MSEAAIEVRGRNGYAVVGPLQFDSVPEVWKKSRLLFQPDQSLVLDLKGVSRADSAALALLVAWTREARRAGARLRFQNIPPQLMALIRAARLENLLV